MSWNKQEKNGAGMIGGVFVMAAGGGLNAVTLGMAGAGIATAFCLKAGYDWLQGERLEQTEAPPKQDNDEKLGL